MKRGEYIETKRGQAHLYRRRKSKRLLLFANQALRNKKSSRQPDQIDFQRQILKDLVKFGRRAYRGDVIVQFHFFSRDERPPNLPALLKHYIDLLKYRFSDSGAKRNHLLFVDDSQITALFARLSLGMEPRPAASANGSMLATICDSEIHIRIAPFRDFLEDLRLLDRIYNDDFEKDDRVRWRRDPDILWGDDEDLRDRQSERRRKLETLNDFERIAPGLSEQFTADQVDAIRRMIRAEYQELFLDVFEPDLFFLMEGYAPSEKSNPTLQAVKDCVAKQLGYTLPGPFGRRDMVLPGFTIDLGNFPSEGDQTPLFRSRISAALKQYRADNPILFPLRCLAAATIFLVPPARNSPDLDNVAQSVLAAVDRELEPPSTYAKTLNEAALPDDETGAFLRDVIRRQKGLFPSGITKLQVLRLPRGAMDPATGNLRLFFHGKTASDTLWNRLDKILDAWAKVMES